tara:strand:- start:609 stop:752 length:144 start_codon:yes stop_codon:yes gene_type:complete
MKFAKDIKRATYLLLSYFFTLGLVKNINIAPIRGSIIKDERIGISII